MNAERPEDNFDEASGETGTEAPAGELARQAGPGAGDAAGDELADNATVESLLAGKSATLKLLATVMSQFGIEEVDPEGEPFDPEFHEAISMQPSDAAEPGSVLQVVQKGYTLNGRLLRPAMVIVAAE